MMVLLRLKGHINLVWIVIFGNDVSGRKDLRANSFEQGVLGNDVSGRKDLRENSFE